MNIKFKVWDSENKNWADHIDFYIDQEGDLCFHEWESVIEAGKRYVKVLSTGQTDKNGIEIYEGDIWKRDFFIAVVAFEHSGWHLPKAESSGCYQYPSFYSNAKTGEIIGNKYENPELLEK